MTEAQIIQFLQEQFEIHGAARCLAIIEAATQEAEEEGEAA
jgi:hypothetical protein